jgi:5'-nucleotidase
MEACLHDIPSIAVSLHGSGDPVRHWATAQAVVRRVVAQALARPLPRRVLLNVNVPNVPLGELKGLRAACLGERRYAPLVSLRTDPRGREYFWLGGEHAEFMPLDGSDGPAVEEGWATVTPIHPDLTLWSVMDSVRQWTDA